MYNGHKNVARQMVRKKAKMTEQGPNNSQARAVQLVLFQVKTVLALNRTIQMSAIFNSPRQT